MQPSTMPPALMPAKLSWVTIPLLINMVLSGLSLLILPFIGAIMSMAFGASATDHTMTPDDIQAMQFVKIFSGATLWMIGLAGLFGLWLHWYAYKSLQQGKAVGRTIAIVLAIFNLFGVPIGTLLGIFMLVGAFDPEVTRYASR